jgi:hypothetical protein
LGRTRPGRRYPHVTTDAKPHEHMMCPVVRKIGDQAAAELEPWGTRHDMPPVPSETIARKVKGAFYSARYCRELGKHFGEPVSIQSDFDRLGDTSYVVWFRVWPRSVAQKEIARRVKNKEPLHYNVLKGS